jgi:2-(1,2-epoxy-1,2-dihydrophenyl)acetyl-CoA isomerase
MLSAYSANTVATTPKSTPRDAELEHCPMTADPTHRVERAGAVATVTLDRPDALNAQTRASRRALIGDLQALSADDAVRCVVLTGAGRAFCAGQDLREPAALENVGETIRETYNPIVETLVGMPKPVVAAINGAAAGAGLSFALACDVRYMAENAVLMMAFSNIALVPDSGGSWLLPRTVGYARAFELAASGRRVAAPEALELGLVQRVLPGEELMAAAQETAAMLAARPTQALGWTKRLMRAAEQGSLAEVMELEAQLQDAAVAADDHAEGVAAFLEKREARFEGR